MLFMNFELSVPTLTAVAFSLNYGGACFSTLFSMDDMYG